MKTKISLGLLMLIGVLSARVGAQDDQFAPLHDKIVAAVTAITEQPVKMLLNTHWHGDHTGGNELFADGGTLIIAHDNVRTRMSASHFSSFFRSERPPSPPAALPVVTFDSTVTLHINGLTIHAQHVPPAHTDGDAIVWFREANVVHLGDTFFNGLYAPRRHFLQRALSVHRYRQRRIDARHDRGRRQCTGGY